MSFKNHIRFTLIVLFGLCVAQTAVAEPTTRTEAGDSGDYSYRFSDDDLLGDTIRDVGDMYRGRPKFARVILLRPRTSLVQELLKSAEDL
ncbi:MAG: hypothetical protein ACM3ZE_19530 [Myxococcales bacterium]